ncbi:MAG TPA: DUF4407 domain-containing protein [Terracidiphilus sp.]|nr:DUF4407 domain-containing protein [Terracidiphilus sp.]
MNRTFPTTDRGTSRPLSSSRRIRNPLSLVLFWASKTDSRLVSVCSHWAIATQAAFGVFVFFTATLAFGAAYYTLSTLNAPVELIPWMACAWSVFYLYLDREIAGSLDKTTALVRPFLALFIGTLVAIPIELWVFQGRIDQELQRQYRQDNKQQLDAVHTEEAKLDQRRTDLEGVLTDLRKQDGDWAKILDSEAVGRAGLGRTGIAGAGPAFLNAQTQQASIRQQIRDIRHDLDEMNRSLPEERQRLETLYGREEVGKVTDFVTRYEALDKVVRSSNALYRLSWLITLALILVEMTPAVLKILTPRADYHHLVRAEIRENETRIDEISDRNYRLAMENPEVPRLSVAEKLAICKFGPVPNTSAFGKGYETKTQA